MASTGSWISVLPGLSGCRVRKDDCARLTADRRARSRTVSIEPSGAGLSINNSKGRTPPHYEPRAGGNGTRPLDQLDAVHAQQSNVTDDDFRDEMVLHPGQEIFPRLELLGAPQARFGVDQFPDGLTGITVILDDRDGEVFPVIHAWLTHDQAPCADGSSLGDRGARRRALPGCGRFPNGSKIGPDSAPRRTVGAPRRKNLTAGRVAKPQLRQGPRGCRQRRFPRRTHAGVRARHDTRR